MGGVGGGPPFELDTTDGAPGANSGALQLQAARRRSCFHPATYSTYGRPTPMAFKTISD